MPRERRIFYSAVGQVPERHYIPYEKGKIPVALHFYKESRYWFDGPYDYELDSPPTLVCYNILQSTREYMSQFVTQELTLLSVPKEEIPSITEKIAQKLSVVSDVPSHMPITVLIVDITVNFVGKADYYHVIDWVESEPSRCMGYPLRVVDDDKRLEQFSYKPRFTPKARSFFHGLKKFRLVDSLQEGFIKETPTTCAICLEDFAESYQKKLSVFPCKHMYHVICIVRSLVKHHFCPLCRYPILTGEGRA